MTDPKHLFENLAQSTWERLRLSWEYDISQGEETITDLLQLEIARFGSPHIHVLKTNKAFEAKSGLDWEWWIGDDFSGWLRFAVQAKKIGPSGRYNALKHRVKLPDGRRLYQHNLLKRYAREQNAIPLYCLFNHIRLNDFNHVHHWHCSDSVDVAQLGCTLAPVTRIEEALRVRGCRTFDFIHQDRNTSPWRCLFCSNCTALPLWLISSRFTTGMPPRRYRNLPVALARAKETDGVFRFNFEDEEDDLLNHEQMQPVNTDLPIFPRRIMLIETNLIELSREITDLSFWE
jgi:hypothetical protein